MHLVLYCTVNHHRSSPRSHYCTVSPLGRYVPCPSLLLFSRKEGKIIMETRSAHYRFPSTVKASTELRILIDQLTTKTYHFFNDTRTVSAESARAWEWEAPRFGTRKYTLHALHLIHTTDRLGGLGHSFPRRSKPVSDTRN